MAQILSRNTSNILDDSEGYETQNLLTFEDDEPENGGRPPFLKSAILQEYGGAHGFHDGRRKIKTNTESQCRNRHATI